MSTATVCRVCLVNNMNLYNVQNDLQKVYEKIAREKYKKVGYPVHMCHICLTVLRKCHRFMETARDTNNVLKQWYKQQNEMREARPLYTYTIRKAELVSTFNEDMTSQYVIKVEEVESEQEEVQREYAERHIDVNIDKIDIDIDEQTDCHTPSQPDNIRHRNTKTKPRLDKNNHSGDRKTKKLDKIVKKTAILNKNKKLARNCIEISKNSNKLELNSCNNRDKNEINRCNYKTKQSTLHVTSRSENKLFECYTCPFKSTQKQNLANHMRTHTGEKTFTCYICDYKCIQKANLTSHMRRHTGEKPFTCDICHYECARKQNLTSHMRKHTGEKPFSCDICHYKFALKGTLTSHMKTHTGEKRFTCSICQYKSAYKKDLAQHMRKHTGEKPFTCDICQYKSAYKKDLAQHMRKHTGEKPFTCDICDYRCNSNQSLKRHLITRHINNKRK